MKNNYLTIIILTAFAFSHQAVAQSFDPVKYIGVEGTFSHKNFILSSDIDELNNLSFQQDGSSAGLLIGNDLSQLVIRAIGLYYPGQHAKRSINLIEMEVNGHINVLDFFGVSQTALDAYLIMGAGMQYFRFFGDFLETQTKTVGFDEPYLGTRKVISYAAGLGLEYQLSNEINFLHFFAEYKMYGALNHGGDEVLGNTFINNLSAVNAGIRFGLQKH